MKLSVEFSSGNPKCGPDDIGCTSNKWESGKSLMDSDLVARIKWQQNNKTKKRENKEQKTIQLFDGFWSSGKNQVATKQQDQKREQNVCNEFRFSGKKKLNQKLNKQVGDGLWL